MTKIGNKIVRISNPTLDNFTIDVEFQDGFSGTVSLRHVFDAPRGIAAEVLTGGIFHQCFVESGALAWPNGLEFCPDSIRIWLENQKNNKAS